MILPCLHSSLSFSPLCTLIKMFPKLSQLTRTTVSRFEFTHAPIIMYVLRLTRIPPLPLPHPPPPPLSLSLSLGVSFSLFCLCLFLSVHFISSHHDRSVYFSVSLCLSLHLSIFACLSPYLSLSLTLSISFSEQV